MPLRTALALATLLCLPACTSWRRIESPPPSSLPPRQQAQVFTKAGRFDWQSLDFTADSVSGVAYWEPPDCLTCRAALPLASVDSIRVGNREAAAALLVGIPLAVAAGVLIVMQTND